MASFWTSKPWLPLIACKASLPCSQHKRRSRKLATMVASLCHMMQQLVEICCTNAIQDRASGDLVVLAITILSLSKMLRCMMC